MEGETRIICVAHSTVTLLNTLLLLFAKSSVLTSLMKLFYIVWKSERILIVNNKKNI